MSAVVLRCPNCGTTRPALGECDACHEAPVRYYCTNHRPGLWLEGPGCDQCGSRFGATVAPPARPAPTPAGTRSPTASQKPEARRAPAPGEAAARRPATPPSTVDRGTAPSRSRVVKRPEPEVPPLAESFEALDELMRGTRPLRRPPPAAAAEPADRARNVPSVGGCLLRLFLVGILLFVFGIGSLMLFGTALLRMFGFY